MMSRVCVVVPTYNEAENLLKLTEQIERALHGCNFNLIVVDDNSPDNTANVAAKLNDTYKNIIVEIRTSKNGLGSAILHGLSKALSMDDVERIVTIDGDLSHDPHEIPRLLSEFPRADIVQGSRYVRHGVIFGWSLRRRVVSCVANLICKTMLRTHINDCTGNFRVYSRKCAETLVNSTNSGGFEWVIEALAIAAHNGFSVREVPITFIDRRIGRTKLSAKEILEWAKFVMNSFFRPNSQRPIFSVPSNTAIHRLSAFSKTSTSPTNSTTKYTLSSLSPVLTDHALSKQPPRSSE